MPTLPGYALSNPTAMHNALVGGIESFANKPLGEQAGAAYKFGMGGFATAGIGRLVGAAGGFAYRGANSSSLFGTAANGPVFAPNLNGVVRTEAEAVALATKYGVQVSDDVVIRFVPDEWLLNKVGAKAEYSQLGKGSGGNISWEDLMMTEGPHVGKIPVRFGKSLLSSDEAIVGHIGHEMFELNKFEAIGSMPRASFAKQIAADPIQFPNNWHSQAWDYSHELMKLMRGTQ